MLQTWILQLILIKDKLNGTYFPKWFRILRNVLISEVVHPRNTIPKIHHLLTTSGVDHTTYKKCIDDSEEVVCMILAT